MAKKQMPRLEKKDMVKVDKKNMIVNIIDILPGVFIISIALIPLVGIFYLYLLDIYLLSILIFVIGFLIVVVIDTKLNKKAKPAAVGD